MPPFALRSSRNKSGWHVKVGRKQISKLLSPCHPGRHRIECSGFIPATTAQSPTSSVLNDEPRQLAGGSPNPPLFSLCWKHPRQVSTTTLRTTNEAYFSNACVCFTASPWHDRSEGEMWNVRGSPFGYAGGFHERRVRTLEQHIYVAHKHSHSGSAGHVTSRPSCDMYRRVAAAKCSHHFTLRRRWQKCKHPSSALV